MEGANRLAGIGKKSVRQVLLIGVGCLLYALAFNLFFDPFLISPGGVSGLAMMLNHLTGFPAGVAIILMNVPLIVLAFIRLGPRFIVSTAVATFLSSILIDLTTWIPTPVEEPILAALCGGVLIGVGLGMIIRAGASTGGTDIISRLLQASHPHLKMGQLVLFVDGAIVCLSSAVFKDFSLMVYALIGLTICSRLMDTILYGFDFATLIYIISDRHQELGDAIQEKLDRGVTYLEAQGGYTMKQKKVILCAIKRGQVAALRGLIESIDPSAFFIVTEGHQIYGDGFLNNR